MQKLETPQPPPDPAQARIDRIKRASIGGAVACGCETIMGLLCHTTEFISSVVERDGQIYGVADDYWWNKEMGYKIMTFGDDRNQLDALARHLEAQGFTVEIMALSDRPAWEQACRRKTLGDDPPAYDLCARRVYQRDDEIRGWWWREAP